MSLGDRLDRLERRIYPSNEHLPILVLDGCQGSEEVAGSIEEVQRRLKTCRILSLAENDLYFSKGEGFRA